MIDDDDDVGKKKNKIFLFCFLLGNELQYNFQI